MELLNSLQNLIVALYSVIVEALVLVAPLLPLIAWVAFWTLAVNWVQLRHFLLKGGIVSVLLIMFLAILIWGVVAPPASGTHDILGLSVTNFVGKTIFVTALFVITMICGSVQLSGLCGPLTRFDDEVEAPSHAH